MVILDMLRSSLFFFSIISITLFCNFCAATDSLSSLTSLADGQTLVSHGGWFELGFFSPGDSNRRYLGIWYQLSPNAVVWVANRNNPIGGLGGIFRIDSGGKLILFNQTESVVWSSNSSKLAQDPRAQLLDTGNFAVMDLSSSASSGDYVWQSFDHPTDTRLPGMRFGRGLNDEPETFLTSWKSANDPSPGEYVYRFRYKGLSEIVMRRGSVMKFRTGPWNGVRFSGVLPLLNSFLLNFRSHVLYNFYQKYNVSFVTREVMSSSGSVDMYLYDDRMNRWTLWQTYPNDPCDNYGRCGANGFCSVVKQSMCECLKGFTPKVPVKWELFDWSDGCVRRVPLNCSRRDGFQKLVGVKLPDMIDYWLDSNMSLRQCEVMCLNNCSCSAYANSNVSQGGSGCLLWFGDLIDMTQFNREDIQQEIYIRLSASELESTGHTRKKRVIMASAFAVASATLLLALLLWCIFSRKERNIKGDNLLKFDISRNLSVSKERNDAKNTKSNKTDFEIPLFSFSSVSGAANNFSPSNVLGEGGFGIVYKGTLLNGEEVAIKRLSTRSKQGWDELKNEAMLIAKLQHRNLVKLLGCCIEGEEQILVYEYLPNKSLDIFLFDLEKPGFLDWSTRVRIIEGIAQGLLYLHQYSRLTIIHRDLKASNILLDDDMNPKISDFGLARIFGNNRNGATNRIVGTYGYMAPEYASEGIFSVKSDVFSFGILLLEILSGKKNTSFYRTDFINLLGYAWDLWTTGKALELKDAKLQEGCAIVDSLLGRYIQVALLCVQEYPVERPTMSEVVSMLSNEHRCLPSPKKPAFSMLRSLVDPSSSKSGTGSYSVNVVTGSIVEAR